MKYIKLLSITVTLISASLFSMDASLPDKKRKLENTAQALKLRKLLDQTCVHKAARGHNGLQALLQLPRDLQKIIFAYLNDWMRLNKFDCKGVALSSDGKLMAAVKRDQVQIWDVEQSKIIKAFPPSKLPVSEDPFEDITHVPGKIEIAIFSPDAQRVVTVSESVLTGTSTPVDILSVWDIHTQTKIAETEIESVKQILFSPNGRYLTAHSYGIRTLGRSAFYELTCQSGQTTLSKPMFGQDLQTASLSAQKTWCAVLLRDVNDPYQVKIFDTTSEQCKEIFSTDPFEGNSHQIALSPNGLFLLFCYRDGNEIELCIYKNQSVDLRERYQAQSTNSTLLPVGHEILAKDVQKIIVDYLGWEHHSLPAPLRTPSHVSAVAVSPDNKYAAYAINGRRNYQVDIFDPETGELKAKIQKLPYEIHNMAFSSQGKYLFVTNYREGTSMYETATGKQVAEKLYNPVFSHDGEKILVSRAGKTDMLVNEAAELEAALDKEKQASAKKD